MHCQARTFLLLLIMRFFLGNIAKHVDVEQNAVQNRRPSDRIGAPSFGDSDSVPNARTLPTGPDLTRAGPNSIDKSSVGPMVHRRALQVLTAASNPVTDGVDGRSSFAEPEGTVLDKQRPATVDIVPFPNLRAQAEEERVLNSEPVSIVVDNSSFANQSAVNSTATAALTTLTSTVAASGLALVFSAAAVCFCWAAPARPGAASAARRNASLHALSSGGGAIVFDDDGTLPGHRGSAVRESEAQAPRPASARGKLLANPPISPSSGSGQSSQPAPSDERGSDTIAKENSTRSSSRHDRQSVGGLDVTRSVQHGDDGSARQREADHEAVRGSGPSGSRFDWFEALDPLPGRPSPHPPTVSASSAPSSPSADDAEALADRLSGPASTIAVPAVVVNTSRSDVSRRNVDTYGIDEVAKVDTEDGGTSLESRTTSLAWKESTSHSKPRVAISPSTPQQGKDYERLGMHVHASGSSSNAAAMLRYSRIHYSEAKAGDGVGTDGDSDTGGGSRPFRQRTSEVTDTDSFSSRIEQARGSPTRQERQRSAISDAGISSHQPPIVRRERPQGANIHGGIAKSPPHARNQVHVPSETPVVELRQLQQQQLQNHQQPQHDDGSSAASRHDIAYNDDSFSGSARVRTPLNPRRPTSATESESSARPNRRGLASGISRSNIDPRSSDDSDASGAGFDPRSGTTLRAVERSQVRGMLTPSRQSSAQGVAQQQINELLHRISHLEVALQQQALGSPTQRLSARVIDGGTAVQPGASANAASTPQHQHDSGDHAQLTVSTRGSVNAAESQLLEYRAKLEAAEQHIAALQAERSKQQQQHQKDTVAASVRVDAPAIREGGLRADTGGAADSSSDQQPPATPWAPSTESRTSANNLPSATSDVSKVASSTASSPLQPKWQPKHAPQPLPPPSQSVLPGMSTIMSMLASGNGPTFISSAGLAARMVNDHKAATASGADPSAAQNATASAASAASGAGATLGEGRIDASAIVVGAGGSQLTIRPLSLTSPGATHKHLGMLGQQSVMQPSVQLPQQQFSNGNPSTIEHPASRGNEPSAAAPFITPTIQTAPAAYSAVSSQGPNSASSAAGSLAMWSPGLQSMPSTIQLNSNGMMMSTSGGALTSRGVSFNGTAASEQKSGLSMVSPAGSGPLSSPFSITLVKPGQAGVSHAGGSVYNSKATSNAGVISALDINIGLGNSSASMMMMRSIDRPVPASEDPKPHHRPSSAGATMTSRRPPVSMMSEKAVSSAAAAASVYRQMPTPMPTVPVITPSGQVGPGPPRGQAQTRSLIRPLNRDSHRDSMNDDGSAHVFSSPARNFHSSDAGGVDQLRQPGTSASLTGPPTARSIPGTFAGIGSASTGGLPSSRYTMSQLSPRGTSMVVQRNHGSSTGSRVESALNQPSGAFYSQILQAHKAAQLQNQQFAPQSPGRSASGGPTSAAESHREDTLQRMSQLQMLSVERHSPNHHPGSRPRPRSAGARVSAGRASAGHDQQASLSSMGRVRRDSRGYIIPSESDYLAAPHGRTAGEGRHPHQSQQQQRPRRRSGSSKSPDGADKGKHNGPDWVWTMASTVQEVARAQQSNDESQRRSQALDSQRAAHEVSPTRRNPAPGSELAQRTGHTSQLQASSPSMDMDDHRGRASRQRYADHERASRRDAEPRGARRRSTSRSTHDARHRRSSRHPISSRRHHGDGSDSEMEPPVLQHQHSSRSIVTDGPLSGRSVLSQGQIMKAMAAAFNAGARVGGNINNLGRDPESEAASVDAAAAAAAAALDDPKSRRGRIVLDGKQFRPRAGGATTGSAGSSQRSPPHDDGAGARDDGYRHRQDDDATPRLTIQRVQSPADADSAQARFPTGANRDDTGYDLSPPANDSVAGDVSYAGHERDDPYKQASIRPGVPPLPLPVSLAQQRFADSRSRALDFVNAYSKAAAAAKSGDLSVARGHLSAPVPAAAPSLSQQQRDPGQPVDSSRGIEYQYDDHNLHEPRDPALHSSRERDASRAAKARYTAPRNERLYNQARYDDYDARDDQLDGYDDDYASAGGGTESVMDTPIEERDLHFDRRYPIRRPVPRDGEPDPDQEDRHRHHVHQHDERRHDRRYPSSDTRGSSRDRPADSARSSYDRYPSRSSRSRNTAFPQGERSERYGYALGGPGSVDRDSVNTDAAATAASGLSAAALAKQSNSQLLGLQLQQQVNAWRLT